MAKTLLKNGVIVNVFTDELERKDVLIENDKIIGVDFYPETSADKVIDVKDKYICPGFIDGHIHIESSMLIPSSFYPVTIIHGTTTIICDPHEIANVCGVEGISFMLDDSKNLPQNIYFVVPSCVPATKIDEAGAKLDADTIKGLYKNKRIIGLGEVMDYMGVINGDSDYLKKINDAKKRNLVVNGHAPLLKGKILDSYISKGINDDHECTSMEEAVERIKKGQMIMIREGSTAHNLHNLLGLFDDKYNHRCLLVTDDKNAYDLIHKGHIDYIIKKAVQEGKSIITAIRMATIQAAQALKLNNVGAIAPYYDADILILNSLEDLDIKDVYVKGKKVVEDKKVKTYKKIKIDENKEQKIKDTIHLPSLSSKDFIFNEQGIKDGVVIDIIPNQLITNKIIEKINFDICNGVDVSKDLLKIAVIERHKATGHLGLGFVKGFGLEKGAIASTVSHDSHNLIIVGTNEEDMLYALEQIKKMHGGLVVVNDKKTLASVELPYAGLMSSMDAYSTAEKVSKLHEEAYNLGINKNISPFMLMAFLSLPVIPHIKITSRGLVDVDKQELISLFYNK